jgi:hypothetical protein
MAHDYLSRNDVERFLAERASLDEGFRAELLANPKAVIAQEFGLGEMPEALVINVVQETPDEIYIVLPADPRQSGAVPDVRFPPRWLRKY